MKKFLLIAAALFAATAGFAQQLVEQKPDMNLKVKSYERSLNKAPMAPMILATENVGGTNIVKKSYSNGLYYWRPSGTMWWGETEEGATYYYSFLTIPPFQDIVMENMYSNPTKTSWYINGTDYSDYADSDGNFDYGTFYYNGYMYYLPTLTYGSYTFTLGEWNSSYGAYMMADSVNNLSFIDQSYGSSMAEATTQYVFGGLSEGWLYGPGYVTSDNVNYTCYSIETAYPAPASPLYIEYAHATVLSNSTTPLADGVTLYLYFYNEDYTEVLGTMQATADDFTLLYGPYSVSYTSTGVCYFYHVTFSSTGTDIFGNTYVEPITIDEPFIAYIDGIDQDGVNFGFMGQTAIADDRYTYTYTYSTGATTNDVTFFSCADTDGNAYSFSYSDTQITMTFRSCFDYVEVPSEIEFYTDETYTETVTYDQMNQLQVSDDGTTVTNVGYSSMDYAFALVNFDWVNQETGEEEYSYELPDWIDELVVEDAGSGYKYVTVTAQALPDGTENRSATIYFEGKGYTSTEPLIVLQGEGASAETGISAVSVTNNANTEETNTYNLAGQLVDSSYKGIVVKNGHKFLKK